MKRLSYIILLFLSVILLSSWGSNGHFIISSGINGILPADLAFLEPDWTTFVADHASDADFRKSSDPSESPKHYINLEDYPEFMSSGRLAQTYDSILALHGFAFVFEKGSLPWSTVLTCDSLKSAFVRGDWNASEKIAADLGHYVGDGHMPLHLTRNYNGQYSGQTGVHSRYESNMVSRYESSLVYSADPAEYLNDLPGFVFSYIYQNFNYVDSVLAGDLYAKQAAGSTNSTTYYQYLWNKTGSFTINLMQHASFSLGSLIYTAWVDAGSPRIHPNAINDKGLEGVADLLPVYPNPASEMLNIPVVFTGTFSLFNIEIYDSGGKLKKNLLSSAFISGPQIIRVNTSDLTSGSYICLLKTSAGSKARKFIVEN